MTVELLPEFLRENYEVHEWKHACAILNNDFPGEWRDIVGVLTDFRLSKRAIATPGGRKSPISGMLDSAFYGLGWEEKKFDTKMVVDETEIVSPTHKVDCYKNRVALEVEWNNKDPFFDRDLNNFRLLHELRAISVGVIITRCDELQDIFDELGRGKSYGQSTTHMSRLLPRIEGGGGGGCPILVFGISRRLLIEDL
ncbi:MAG: BglII/BstYI family type II restriction endonuclease [Acidobacteriota bacterium]